MKRGFLKSAKAFSNNETPKNRAVVAAQPKNSVNRTQIAPTPTVPALHGRDGKLTADYQDDEWMLSTQPRYPPGAEYPDSCSECMITGRAKRKILNTPGFPEPLPRPNPPCFRISDSPGKGLGMFATRDIKMGDLIIAERALLIIPRAAPPGLVPAYPTEEQTRRASAKEYERYLEVMMQRLPWESRVAFKQLCNHNRDDGIGPLVSTAGMNSFLIQDYFEPSHGKPGVPEGYGCYGGVFKTLSRINHSCRPNALQDWDSPSFSLQLRASRDIKKDEEIFISYIPAGIMDPAPTRQERLEPYRFKCDCQACSNPTVSDERCRKIEDVGVLRRTIEVNGNDMGWVQEQLINPSLECVKLMEEEGLQCEELYRVSLLRLAENYSFLGDTVEETKWRRMYDVSRQAQCSARNPMNEATRIKEETERRAHKEVLAKIRARKGQSFVVEL